MTLLRRRARRKQALKDALARSVLITSIIVPPPTATAAQLRERARRVGASSRAGFVITCLVIAALAAVFVLAEALSIPQLDPSPGVVSHPADR